MGYPKGIKYTKVKILYCFSEFASTQYNIDVCTIDEVTLPCDVSEVEYAYKVVMNLMYGTGKANIEKLQHAETVYANIGNGWEYVKDRSSGRIGVVDLDNIDDHNHLVWSLLQA